jgi:hypothetical protein
MLKIFLQKYGLENLLQKLEEEKISYNMLNQVSDNDFRQLGFKIGDILCIRNSLENEKTDPISENISEKVETKDLSNSGIKNHYKCQLIYEGNIFNRNKVRNFYHKKVSKEKTKYVCKIENCNSFIKIFHNFSKENASKIINLSDFPFNTKYEINNQHNHTLQTEIKLCKERQEYLKTYLVKKNFLYPSEKDIMFEVNQNLDENTKNNPVFVINLTHIINMKKSISTKTITSFASIIDFSEFKLTKDNNIFFRSYFQSVELGSYSIFMSPYQENSLKKLKIWDQIYVDFTFKVIILFLL